MGTWIVGGILALAVVFIIRYLIKQKKMANLYNAAATAVNAADAIDINHAFP